VCHVRWAAVPAGCAASARCAAAGRSASVGSDAPVGWAAPVGCAACAGSRTGSGTCAGADSWRGGGTESCPGGGAGGHGGCSPPLSSPASGAGWVLRRWPYVTGLNGARWGSGAASGAEGGAALTACCQSAGDSTGGALSVPVSGGSSSSADCWPNSLGSLVDGHRNVPSSSPLRDSVPAGPFTGVWSCSWSAKAVPLSSDR
jgi:hypothetical protein